MCPSMDPTNEPSSIRRSVLHNRRHCPNLCFLFSKKYSKCPSTDPTNRLSFLRWSFLHKYKCCENHYFWFSKKTILSVCQWTPLTDRNPYDGPSFTPVDVLIIFVYDFIKNYSKCPSMDPTDGPSSLWWSILQNCRRSQKFCFWFSK